MPSFRVLPGLLFRVEAIADQLDVLLGSAEVTGGSARLVTAVGETFTYTVRGTGLIFEDSQLISGTIQSVTASLTDRLGYEMRLRNLDLDVTEAQAARSGGEDDFETLLYTQDWILRDNTSASSFAQGDPSADGTPIRLPGDDDIRLGWGNDRIEAGGGNDTVRGGGREDQLDGNAGDDLLFGGRGHDVVRGGTGDDTLKGGGGFDVLEGGRGADLVDGGARRDTLTGGAGRDTFLFEPGDGPDVITDFAPGRDSIEIQFSGTALLEQFGGGLLIRLGGEDSVFLIDVLESDLTPSDISYFEPA